MRHHHGLRALTCVLCLLATGCTTLREVPRSQYSTRAEREHVRIVTSDGLIYEFDYARFSADSLVGYRRREGEGRFDDFASLQLPLEEVARLSTRQIDWRRTSMLGGGVVAGVVAAGLATSTKSDTPQRSSGGGSGRPPD